MLGMLPSVSRREHLKEQKTPVKGVQYPLFAGVLRCSFFRLARDAEGGVPYGQTKHLRVWSQLLNRFFMKKTGTLRQRARYAFDSQMILMTP